MKDDTFTNTDVAGPCAKRVVRCTIVTTAGERFVGENACRNPQTACPREPGEGYEKCRTVCNQEGHAEVMALRAAGIGVRGALAYVEGHERVCIDCQRALFGAGAAGVVMGAPR